MFRESVEGRHIPNAGFLEDVVVQDPSLTSTSQASDSFGGDTSIDQENGKDGANIDAANTNYNLDSSSTTQTDLKNDISEQLNTDVGQLNVSENTSTDETNAEEQHTLSIGDVDALLDKCLLQALHTTVKDKDLPMPGSTLW